MTSATTSQTKNRRLNIGNAAVLLIGMGLFGQILGFLRTKLVNGNFPLTGPESTDAYFAAFSIPDFFFFTLAAGALGVAFMPALSDRLQKNDRKGVWELATWLLNLLAIVMTIVGVIMFVFAEQLIHNVVAPSLEGQQFDNAVTIMRLIAFNPLLFTISGIITAVQQTFGRFFFYAIAPLFYNLSIIASIYIFKDSLGLVGLGIGATFGAVLQLAIVMVGNWNLNFHYRPKVNWKNKEFQSVLRNLPARSLDQGIDQVNSIVEINVASSLRQGSISNYSNAYVLSTAPILLIGTAISTAAFPRLNQHLSQGRPDLFRKDFLKTLRVMIWISAPIVITGFFARGYLARLIFTEGNAQIASIFGFLTAAIFFRILYSIMSRWFYSQKDTRTPLLVSVFTIGLNIYLAITLARATSYDVEGLAIAQSIVATLEVFVLGAIMLYRDNKLFDRDFLSGVWKVMSVTGFSVVAGYIAVTLYPLNLGDTGFITLGSKLTLIAGVIIGTHVALSALFGLEEVKPIFKRVKKLVFKPVRLN